MTNPEAIVQMARLTGRAAFYGTMGFQEGDEPAQLDDAQRALLRGLIGSRIDEVAAALVEEAMASDDVIDAGSANVYLRDRLEFLGDLLTDEQQKQIMSAFERRVAAWGPAIGSS